MLLSLLQELAKKKAADAAEKKRKDEVSYLSKKQCIMLRLIHLQEAAKKRAEEAAAKKKREEV
jgi:hypothetical protein